MENGHQGISFHFNGIPVYEEDLLGIGIMSACSMNIINYFIQGSDPVFFIFIHAAKCTFIMRTSYRAL
jgi:hypothetical protein